MKNNRRLDAAWYMPEGDDTDDQAERMGLPKYWVFPFRDKLETAEDWNMSQILSDLWHVF